MDRLKASFYKVKDYALECCPKYTFDLKNDDYKFKCRCNNSCSLAMACDELQDLIDNRLTHEEAEFIIDLLKPYEEELGYDISFMIDKLRMTCKESQDDVVTVVEFDF